MRRSIPVPFVAGAFRGTIVAGVLLGACAALAFAPDRPRMVMAMAAAVAAAIAGAVAAKVIAGAEDLSWYHYQLLALGAAALTARSPATLDAFAVGLAVMHGVGRIGCLIAGCCHGRPSRIGVRYGDAHVANGFAPHFAGVTVIPTQWIESLAEFLLGIWCASDLLRGAASGTAFVHYIGGYAVARFAIEFLRGDERRFLFGVSEAQWIATAVMTGVAIATRTTPAILLASAMAALAIVTRRRGGISAEALARAVRGPRTSCIATAGSLLISRGEEAGYAHYTLSSPSQPLTRNFAARVARLLRTIDGHASAPQLIAGTRGVFHVVFAAEERA